MASLVPSISLACFLYAFFVFLCPFCSSKEIHVGEGHNTTLNYLFSHNITAMTLLPSVVCNRSRVFKEGTLEVVHRYGPCVGEANQETVAMARSLAEILSQDQSRVDSVHARLSMESGSRSFKAMDDSRIPLKSGVDVGVGNYVVKVGLGTPKRDFTLIFDTGSDITWVQCEPCTGSCYQQKEPKFNPSKSVSYRNVSCSSTSCGLISEEGSASGCSSSTCLYGVLYGDNSYSIGFFASEKLTITPFDVFKNFLFGCGQKNAGHFGQSAGLLGLARSPLSVASQTANKYKNSFSYCVPSSSSSTGYLKFGGKFSKTVKFTPLSKKFQDTPFYGLDIVGITVGGQKLAIDASIFTEAGTIIDSGTVISRLPPTAYSALKSAFRSLMKGYALTDGFSIFDTCYDLSDQETVYVPKISLFFQGEVELEIDVLGILIPVNGLKQICLAFAGNDDDGDSAIIGNVQQRTKEVVHDGVRGMVGFAPSGC